MNKIRPLLLLLALFLGLPTLLFALLGLLGQRDPLVLNLDLGQKSPLVLHLDQPALAQTPPYFVNGSWECRSEDITNFAHCRAVCPGEIGEAIICEENGGDFVPISCGQVQPCVSGTFVCGIGFANLNECLLARQAPPPGTPPPTSGGGGGGSSGGGAVLAGGAALLVFHFANHWTDNWSQEFLPEGLEVKPRGNVVYRDGWSGAFAGLTATYGDWTMNASSRHSGAGWSGPDARLDWRALDYAGWVVNASGSYSGGQWAKPYAKVEWSWRF